MKNWFDSLIANFQLDPWVMTLALGFWLLIVAALVLVFMASFAGITSWLERRIAGRMQSRIGPNRVGLVGFWQWLADGLKSFLKEDVIPDAADRTLFKMAPYLVFPGGFAAFAALPWGYGIIASNIDIGIFYVTSITTLVVLGILMAGWSSNNKWSLIGGVRSASQMISYEIPAGLSVLTVVAVSGTLNMQNIVALQGGWPWQWYFFNNPFTFISFFIFFASILAEGNRTPFDLPEAESELVAGYLVEYSGMRFLFFLFTEWANVWTMSALLTTLFLGGWQIPGIADLGAVIAAAPFAVKILWVAASIAVFFIKTSVFVFIVIWVRWTLPRLRVDQLMLMCWKYFVPIGFVCLLGSALCVVLPQTGLWQWFWLGMRLLLTGLGFAIAIGLIWRAFYNLRAMKDKVYIKIWA
ncbi:MAG TPA: NADH-quinone oxidoreductase subunit NuoH [bacterium]|nr:NADH-quinone oxidoreductase subunit NuoH [bacterium]HPR87072.1 NADH-quinone oxidoreductase subunit NuoH [bacterium]